MIKKYLKKEHIYPEERQEVIDELRLKQYNNEISNDHKSFKKFTAKQFRDSYK